MGKKVVYQSVKRERVRAEGVPGPTISEARHVDLPDGSGSLKILGGYSADEREFYAWWWDEVVGAGKIEDVQERKERQHDLDCMIATFMESHIESHDMCYPGTSRLLPQNGFDLFWSLNPDESLRICRLIVRPPSFFADPKAEPSSANG